MVLQNSCLPSTSGPLPSNKVHTGAPPNAKQWTIQGGLRDNATLQLSYGMIFCYNVTWLLLAMVVSLLPVAAGVIAIYTLPAHIAQNLAASAGACNSPTYLNAYQYTPFEMGHLVADTAAWCEVQADHCNTNSFFTQISHRVYEQADPAAAKFVGSAERRVVPCHANDCAHFDDDMPSSLPRCVENASRSDWCPELLLLLRNSSVAGLREPLPPCVIDVLVECNQQTIVAALDWVPTADIVPPLTCARRAAEDLLTLYSWREPVETLQNCARLMLAHIAFYITFILTAIMWKKLIVGRFQSGTWDLLDLRSNEFLRQLAGYLLSYMMFSNDSLSKALTGSQCQLVLYSLSGMRVGRRVFVDRDTVLMGECKRVPRPTDARMSPHERAAVLSTCLALLCVRCTDEDLLLLGDGACVGAGAYLAAHELTRNGKFKRGSIDVGAGCTVGPGARLTSHVTVEAGSNVPALTCALPGQTFFARDAMCC